MLLFVPDSVVVHFWVHPVLIGESLQCSSLVMLVLVGSCLLAWRALLAGEGNTYVLPCSLFYPTLFHIVLALKTSPMQRLPTSQKETATIPTYNNHIVHIQYMSTSLTTHLTPLRNTTPCM